MELDTMIHCTCVRREGIENLDDLAMSLLQITSLPYLAAHPQHLCFITTNQRGLSKSTLETLYHSDTSTKSQIHVGDVAQIMRNGQQPEIFTLFVQGAHVHTED